jgi:hypothetical protein
MKKKVVLLVLCGLFPIWMKLATSIGLPEYSAWLAYEYTAWQVLDTRILEKRNEKRRRKVSYPKSKRRAQTVQLDSEEQTTGVNR